MIRVQYWNGVFRTHKKVEKSVSPGTNPIAVVYSKNSIASSLLSPVSIFPMTEYVTFNFSANSR